MAFAVVIDVPPIEAATAARTIATCNATLGPDQCVLGAGNSSAGPPSRWYAIVRFGADGEARLTIELYDGDRSGSRDESRVASSELEFKERDSPEERWASAGVVVAALVLAQPVDRSPVEKDPQPPTPVAQPVPVARQAPLPTAARWLRLDLGVTAGSEERGAPLRVGPLARVGIAFANAPVFAFASGAYTLQNSASTDLSWLTGSLGAGVRVSFAHERGVLEARGEAVLETLGIEATDGERTESARRTRVGPRFGLDLSGYLTKNWALLAGVEAGVLGPRVVIDVAGQTRELPPFAWGLISAVRYDFR